jgi:ubiquinone/menaquinone biosynthesis C-methylase UbiE
MNGQVTTVGGDSPIESGSYSFERFNKYELERLMCQGRATWDDEVELLRWAGLRTGDRVLDVGCGPGVISGLIAEFVGPEGTVTGVDISDELLATGRALNSDRVSFYRGSAYELGAFCGQFDFAYVRLLFQHLSRPSDAMDQILATLRPGGRVCVLDSDESVFGIHPQPPGLARLVSETQELQQQRGGDRFVGGKLAYYMKDAGFNEVEPRILVMTPDSMGRKQFLDTVLSWRPLLYPDGTR